MSTALIVGHPDLAASRVSAALTAAAAAVPSVAVRVLSELYPEGRPDVEAEQAALENAGDVVLLYPTYWYSPPALLKRWLDEVLLRGWAYGTGGAGALAGKSLRVVTTTGGGVDGYREGELHSFEYDAILAPLKATAHRLGMLWRDPVVVHGVRDIDDEQLRAIAEEFESLLAAETDASRESAPSLIPGARCETKAARPGSDVWRPRAGGRYSQSHIGAALTGETARHRMPAAGSEASK